MENFKYDILIANVYYTMAMTLIAIPRGWMPSESKVLNFTKITQRLLDETPKDWFNDIRKLRPEKIKFRVDARRLKKKNVDKYNPDDLLEFIHEETEFLWGKFPLASGYMRLSKIKELEGEDLKMWEWYQKYHLNNPYKTT